MYFDGLILLHFLSFFVSAMSLTISLALFLLQKERWRFVYSLFTAAGIFFVLCDTLGLLIRNGAAWIQVVLLALVGLIGLLMVPLLLKLYKYGMYFVLKRWEKRYLFLFLIPVIYLTVAVFLYFSFDVFPLYVIIISYCSGTGLVIYLLSLRGTQKETLDKKSADGERELAFFLLTTIVLLPLEFLEYLFRIIKLGAPLFPMRLVIVPFFLLETAMIFIVAGFRSVLHLGLSRNPGETSHNLTEREKEISCLVAQGLTHREIALKLFISQRTVDRHIENIYRKCGAKNKADFIRSVITSH